MEPGAASGIESGAGTRASGAPVRIEARGVICEFPTAHGVVRAVGPVDLSVRDREFCCLVGPSGCGKSTLLRVIGGLAEPSAGTLAVRIFDGESISPLAFVFQDYGIYPWKTTTENVGFGLQVAGVPQGERLSRVQRWLAALRLGGFERAYPRELSGGMRQRVSIARAMAVDPQVLLMDEPFAAVDPQMRVLLQDEVLRLWQADARTVVMVTHSLEEALVLADRVVVMSARPGRVLAEVDVPFPRPRDEHVRDGAVFRELHAHLWELLRAEVEPARAVGRT
jgi:ABC-type nitrate/sulfonate/bicarbonate transport system ATPase subunit